MPCRVVLVEVEDVDRPVRWREGNGVDGMWGQQEKKVKTYTPCAQQILYVCYLASAAAAARTLHVDHLKLGISHHAADSGTLSKIRI